MQDASPAAQFLKSAALSLSEGCVGQAQALCAKILEAAPQDAGALHLLGIIAHQSRDLDTARDLLQRAAESPDASALYLLSYAELCCKAADPARAIELARRAAAMDGTLPLAWLCLGTLLLETRQYAQSRDCLERALELDERIWQVRINLAIVMGRLGQSDAAMDHFQRLLHEERDNAAVAGNFAGFLLEQGRYAEALTYAQKAIARQPDLLDHRLRAAEIEILLGNHGSALARLNAAAEIWPEAIGLLALKAHTLRLMDGYDEAVTFCRNALAKGLESADLLRAFALALHWAGEHDEALAVFDRAATANTAVALSDKGVLLSQLGRFAEAYEAFDRALIHDPTSADVWYNRANTKRYVAEDVDIASMERLLEDTCAYRDRLLLHFALGKAHMDAGNHDSAFLHWGQGNRMKRAAIDYDASAAAQRMESIAAQLPGRATPHRASGFERSELPVFIVGMPRCGSSLVEQILASHPQVCGGGELIQLRRLFEAAAPDASGSGARESQDHTAEMALNRLRRVSTHAERIIDKDLTNFLHLRIIHRIFPRARIIHCRRDPLDTCFSVYGKLFVGDFGYAYEMRELGMYFRHYHALMAHWRSVLPGSVFLDVDYETLVAKPQSETRRLLDFVDMPWNDACLRFFETSRMVNTASFAQVRRPIYRSSVGRALTLRSHLEPLIEALGDLAPAH